MLTYIMKKLGFVPLKEMNNQKKSWEEKAINEYKSNEVSKKNDFLKRTMIGCPVICTTNYNNVIAVGIVRGYHSENVSNPLPLVQYYFNNREDKDIDLNELSVCFSGIVEFSEQRLKAFLKLTGEERCSITMNGYKYGRDAIEFDNLAEKQPTYEDVMEALSGTDFFKEAEKFYI